MDKITRKELKSDRFALEVEHSVEFVSGHRAQFIRWGSIGLALALVVIGIQWYRSSQHEARQQALNAAMQTLDAQVGPAQNEFQVMYPSQADKDKAVNKAFTDLAAKYPSSDEGLIAQYYLASQAADKGDLPQAEKRFRLVADSGERDYAALANLALAQIYQSEGKVADAEKLVRTVMDHPTALVSKEQATISLARLVAPSNPQEARKLLEPLRASSRSAVSRAALTALSDLPQK